jgi:eukaryotic-like serine/threonine-protein kinase
MESKLPSSLPPLVGAEPGLERPSGERSDPRATHVIAGSSSVDTENVGMPARKAHDSPESLPVQKTLSKLGDYLLLKKIGSGAMGAVYLAEHLPTGKHFALKVLFRHVAANPKLLERFHREADVTRALDHPNMVRGYGSGKDHKWHYFAMEYVDGISLQKWLNRVGKISLGDALHVIVGCARALDYAHAKGVVHRDIKPDNILVTRRGEVKVADLGMVKRLDEDMSLTQTGHAVGTPWYMPLEQARNAKDTDGRCDTYALGCVFYACLTGQPPFTGPTLVDVIQAKEAGTFPRARKFNNEVPERVDMIIAKMAAKSPKDRYQKLSDLLHDLEGLGLANDSLHFLASVAPGSADQASPGLPSKPSSGGDAKGAEPDKPKTPEEDIWYVRYKRANGEPIIQKMTAEKVLELLQLPNFDPAVKASRRPTEGFRALATFKEFEKAAMGRISRSLADQQTFRQRRLYERIVQQQQEHERVESAPVTTFQYWFGIFARAGAAVIAVGMLLGAIYWICRSLL